MLSTVRTRPLIESLLLRKSLGDLASSRTRCVDCHRTPLAGEVVHSYAAPEGREELVCELCRPGRRGAPTSSRDVASPEHDRSVQLRASRAA